MNNIAHVYAMAFLEVAIEDNKVEQYLKEANQLIEIFNENNDLIRLLKDYGLSIQNKKDIIDECFKDRLSEHLINLIYVVLDNKRGGYIKDILVGFSTLASEKLGIKHGIIFTTIKLELDEIRKIEEKISKKINAKVTLVNKIDNDLIGGFKIVVGDYILDDSIKNRLLKLKETINIQKGEIK